MSAPTHTGLPSKPLKASQIHVEEFRQILLWPLVLDRNKLPEGDAADAVTPFLADLSDGVAQTISRLEHQHADIWRNQANGVDYLDARPGEPASLTPSAYAEFVYFHSFVQDFLYATGEGGGADSRCFRRQGIDRVSVALKADESGSQFCLTVPRIELRVFPNGVAVLLVEMMADGASAVGRDDKRLTLDDVLMLQEYLRRV